MRGTIYKRAENVWQIRFDKERGPDGKRRYHFATVHGSYKDAQKERTRLLATADAGTLPDANKATVAPYLTQWLDGAHDVSPKTRERYRELATHQIIPHLGGIPIQKLTPERLRAWHGALLEGGLAPQTVKHAHRVLQSALKFAHENGTIVRNVAAKMKLPKIEAAEIEILTPEEIAVMLDKLADHPLFALWALAIGQAHAEVNCWP